MVKHRIRPYGLLLALVLLTLNIMKVIPLGDSGASFNMALSDILLPFVVLFMIVKLARERSFKSFPYIWCALLLMVWIVFTNILAVYQGDLNTVSWSSAIGEWVKTGTCLVYFYVGYHFLMYCSKKVFFRLYAIGYLIFSLVGYGVLFMLQKGISIPSWFVEGNSGYFLGTYHDPNHAATYVVFSTIIIFLAFYFDASKLWKIIYGFSILCSFLSILLANSRGGLIAFVATLGIYLLLNYARRPKSLITAILLGIALVLGALWFDSYFYDGTYFAQILHDFMNFDNGLSIREGLGDAALMMAKDHLLFGVGRGNFSLNSSPYFQQMGVDFIDNIPHNTYFGVTAESGILGFLLYFFPLFAILYQLIKKIRLDRSWLRKNRIWLFGLLSAGIGIAIEAGILNIENRRMLWFVGGIVLYGIVSECFVREEFANDRETVHLLPKSIHSYINVGLGLLILASFLLLPYELHIPREEMTLYGDYEQEIVVPDEWVGKTLSVEYSLNSLQDNLDNSTTVQVSIIEIESSGKKHIRQTFDYPQTNGNLYLSFIKKSYDSTIIFHFSKINPLFIFYTFSLKNVVFEGQAYSLSTNYYLLSPINSIVTSAKHIQKKSLLYPETTFGEKNVNFADIFQLNSLSLSKSSTDSETQAINFSFHTLQDIDQKYFFSFYSIPDNLHTIDTTNFIFGTENYKSTDSINTVGLKSNQTFSLNYLFPHSSGSYHLILAVYSIDSSTGAKNYLYTSNYSSRVYDLGWLTLP